MGLINFELSEILNSLFISEEDPSLKLLSYAHCKSSVVVQFSSEDWEIEEENYQLHNRFFEFNHKSIFNIAIQRRETLQDFRLIKYIIFPNEITEFNEALKKLSSNTRWILTQKKVKQPSTFWWIWGLMWLFYMLIKAAKSLYYPPVLACNQ